MGSAFPDPPFEVPGSPPAGLDLDLVHALAAGLGRPVELHRYEGADFEGIFALLGRSIDLVASGATVTEHRRTLARWCTPYLRSGQSLAVDATATPGVRGTGDLTGLILGVQDGNTSQPVAEGLHTAGRIAGVKVYAYGEIGTALDDLEQGAIGGFMKLEPVLRRLVADRPKLRIAQTGITTELIAMAVALDDAALAGQLDAAQEAIRRSGELARIGGRWLAGSDPAATAVLT